MKVKEEELATPIKYKWFEMTLNVLRSTNDAGENEMMKLIRYSVDGTSTTAGNDHGSLNPGSQTTGGT